MGPTLSPEPGTLPTEGRIAFTVAETAILCGLSERFLFLKIRSGELRAARIGTAIRILRADLENWLESKADNSGTTVRPDLSEAVTARNRARARVR